MDLQKMATIGTATAVVGTGTVVGGLSAVDHVTGGPEKRTKAEATELRLIVREEVQNAIRDMMPKATGGVVTQTKPGDYRKEVPKR